MMEFSNNVDFDNYVEAFKKLKLKDKKSVTIDEFKKTLMFLNKANERLNVKTSILANKELLDLNSGMETEDDYVEAIFVCINSVNELVADLAENIEERINK